MLTETVRDFNELKPLENTMRLMRDLFILFEILVGKRKLRQIPLFSYTRSLLCVYVCARCDGCRSLPLSFRRHQARGLVYKHSLPACLPPSLPPSFSLPLTLDHSLQVREPADLVETDLAASSAEATSAEPESLAAPPPTVKGFGFRL